MPIWHLVGEDGKLVPIPGDWKLEDFEALWKLQRQLQVPDRRPQHTLERLLATGTANRSHAELTVQLGILVHEDNWVGVPLRLDGAMLREAKYQGPAEQQFVRFQQNGNGYVGWIHGKAGQEHQFTLELLVPLSEVGGETRLKLLAPRATTSQLKLTVPVANAVARVSEGATLEPPSQAGSGATQFTAHGLDGSFQLSWHKAGSRVAKVPTVLEAVGTVFARIDGRGVDTEAILSVRSHGAPFDRFRVRLPKSAQPVLDSPNGFEVVEVDSVDSTVPRQRVVEVRLKEKRAGPVDVRLVARRPHDVVKPDAWFELAGFEVVGAVRQSGHIAIAAPGDLQVLWRVGHGIQQIDEEKLPERLRHQDVVAAFEYFTQPCSLTTRLVTRRTRISVEPRYLLLVDAAQVRLEASLKYTIRGAKAASLDVVLPPGWELDEVGPDNLVAVDGVEVIDSRLLSIPLLQPSTGQIELEIRAAWPVPADAKSLVLPLPQPRVNSPGPAVVVVLPADNVELTPDRESMVGLTSQQVDPQIELPPRQQAPLSYRTEASEAVFAADFRVLKQSITVEVATQLNLGHKAGRVQQRLAYTVAHEPVDHFMVELPRRLAEAKELEFSCEGQALAHAILPADGNQEHSSKTVRTRVDLLETRIGPCELVARYPLRLPKLTPGKPIPIAVPLVMPSEGKLSGNRLYVTAAPDIELNSRRGPWTVSQPGAERSGKRPELLLTTRRRPKTVELAVRLTGEDDPGTTVVERAWVQTWLSDTARKDRAVFTLTSNCKELELIIPRGAATDQIEVRLDGRRVVGKVADGRLLVLLSSDTNHRRYVLELQSHFPQPRRRRSRLSIELPRLAGDVWVRRLYWQLVLPQNEHVIVAPKGFTSEFTWGWDGYFWGRKPLFDQSELETWAGAAAENPVPEGNNHGVREHANHYLFSSFGNVQRCELRVAGRTWIVLFASGAALVAGLLLIYVPASRHPGTLLGAGVVLLCVGILYPEPALLVSQAASLGLALTLLAGLLQRSMVRRRRGATWAETSSSVLENGSTQAQFQLPAPGNQISTRTAPAVAPPPPPDSSV